MEDNEKKKKKIKARLLTTQEALIYLKIKDSRVLTRLVKSGLIKRIDLASNMHRFDKNDLDEFIENQKKMKVS